MKKEILIKNNNLENSDSTEKNGRLVLLFVLIITAIVFSGSLKLEWTNWDDDLYIYENPLVSEGTLKDIFTTLPASNTYNPLVIAFFALEWKLVKDRPFLYHLNNLVLHLLCTSLVMLFSRRLGLSVWWCGFAALLFGIHPLRVESVAWITERKDMLYALFYLAALLSYIRYIVTCKNVQLLITFIFFTLSLLSKIQAVTLPLALVLLDWYYKRNISTKVIIEKVVFFAVSMVYFLLCYFFFIKKANFTTSSNALISLDQAVLGGYGYAVYILKSIFPYVTSTCYPIPASLQTEHWAGAAIAVVFFVSALAVWRKYRFITFGLLFFTFNIFPLLLAFKAGETAFLNDRYTYIAYIGLFFIIAMCMQQLSEKYTSFRLPAVVVATILLSIFTALTIKYIPVWQNSKTLWTHVIEKYPRKIPIAYVNRGQYLYTKNQSDKALEDFSTAIEINPDYLLAYQNRGFIYLEKNDIKKALQDYNRYIDLLPPYDTSGNVSNPLVSDTLGNRGVIYSKMGQHEKALVDFDLAIKLNPQNLNNYLNRAFAYMQLRKYDKSIRDFNTCHQSDPTDPEIINNRGVCFFRSGDFKSALDDFNKAVLINGSNPYYYRNRAYTYHKLGQIAEARKDLLTAEKMGAATDPAFKKLLHLR